MNLYLVLIILWLVIIFFVLVAPAATKNTFGTLGKALVRTVQALGLFILAGVALWFFWPAVPLLLIGSVWARNDARREKENERRHQELLSHQAQLGHPGNPPSWPVG